MTSGVRSTSNTVVSPRVSTGTCNTAPSRLPNTNAGQRKYFPVGSDAVVALGDQRRPAVKSAFTR